MKLNVTFLGHVVGNGILRMGTAKIKPFKIETHGGCPSYEISFVL